MKLFGLFLLTVSAQDWLEISLDRAGSDANDQGYQKLLVENDDKRLGTEAKLQFRKYENIAKAILYLHAGEDREWGRYMPYGCHCAVNGPTDLLAGSGQPLDEIDSACKRHKECTTCAMSDFDQASCPWWKPYKMTVMFDNQTGEKKLVCCKLCRNSASNNFTPVDEPNSCKRSLCECDMQLAKDIYEQRESYNRNNHHTHGSIDTNQVVSIFA